MRSGWVGLLFSLPLLYGGCEWWAERPVRHAPGVLVSAVPVQTAANAAPAMEKPGYRLKPLARYEIRARVLSKERYRWDAGAGLVPFDIAFGWGPMSDSAILDQMQLWQDGRWYQWRAKTRSIAPDTVSRHSANMHLIAADKMVARQIARLRAGQVVLLRGYLVEARRDDGFVWISSLTREDTGNGSCELMWVEMVDTN